MTRRAVCVTLACAAASWLAGCSGLEVAERNSLIGAAIGTAMVTPSADIEQVYYLGSFDPRDQLPPTIYRIRLRGQSSILNGTRFASSWVPAAVVDSLTGAVTIDTAEKGKGAVTLGQPTDADRSSLEGAGRRLMLFGPEGFRQAPAGHRLVVIMGSNPENVEQAFASALGTVAQARFGRSGSALDREILELLLELGQERELLRTAGGGK